MANKGYYIAEINHRVCGIPCRIGVKHYSSVKGSYTAESDWDFYGYNETDWELLDRKGYRAEWLERKLTTRENDAVEEAILKHFA
jgi:hypothetical protein